MFHRRYQRSPSHRSTPDNERRRDRRGGDYNNEREDRARTSSHRRGGSRSREPERRRERSASSISSTSNHSDGEIETKRKIELPRHKSQDARKADGGTPTVRRSSIEPPPVAPQLERTSISDTSLPHNSPKQFHPTQGHSDKHLTQESAHLAQRKDYLPGHVEKRLSSGSHSNPSAQGPHPHHQMQHKFPKQLPHVSATNSKSYHCKPFNRSFRIPEMDPRKFPYPKKDIHRLILPLLHDFDKKHNHRKRKFIKYLFFVLL
uniref:Uncharacterized protein n=1 Tax=Panagrolaimus davidi TaxID=227884 RepID=A0A914R0P2_9BILA